jgi:hypothetical protein
MSTVPGGTTVFGSGSIVVRFAWNDVPSQLFQPEIVRRPWKASTASAIHCPPAVAVPMTDSSSSLKVIVQAPSFDSTRIASCGTRGRRRPVMAEA